MMEMDSDLTADELRRVLDYNPRSGEFFWRVRLGKGKTTPGQRAGCLHDTSNPGYRTVTIGYNGRNYRAHRLAWLHYYGEWPSGLIDHKNGDPTDNRISNLRVCDQRQNLANTRIRRSNTTGYKGVYYDKARDKFSARIRDGGKRKTLGRFDTAEEAAAVYKRHFKRIYGEFARMA